MTDHFYFTCRMCGDVSEFIRGVKPKALRCGACGSPNGSLSTKEETVMPIELKMKNSNGDEIPESRFDILIPGETAEHPLFDRDIVKMDMDSAMKPDLQYLAETLRVFADGDASAISWADIRGTVSYLREGEESEFTVLAGKILPLITKEPLRDAARVGLHQLADMIEAEVESEEAVVSYKMLDEDMGNEEKIEADVPYGYFDRLEEKLDKLEEVKDFGEGFIPSIGYVSEENIRKLEEANNYLSPSVKLVDLPKLDLSSQEPTYLDDMNADFLHELAEALADLIVTAPKDIVDQHPVLRETHRLYEIADTLGVSLGSEPVSPPPVPTEESYLDRVAARVEQMVERLEKLEAIVGTTVRW